MNGHDLQIVNHEDWKHLQNNELDAIVDPLIYRIGQLFMEGGNPSAPDNDARWAAIEQDIGALVGFFDLIVLHKRLAAFNYTDTFDQGLNFDQSLGGLVNTPLGVKKILSVNVTYEAYMQAKQAAVSELQERMKSGAFISEHTARDILTSLGRISYQWEPSLLGLEEKVQDTKEFSKEEQLIILRFLGGLLVFGAYAQQGGVPHVLAPRRSRLIAAVGLATDDNPAPVEEAEIFRAISRRIREAEGGWRARDLPWAPSFLPYLLSCVGAREGPDALLQRGEDLAKTRSVNRYRTLRSELFSTDAKQSDRAETELKTAADAIAAELRQKSEQMEVAQNIFIEFLPKTAGAAMGAVAGGLVGGLVAGPGGAAGGAAVGAAGEQLVRFGGRKLWGWTVDKLPVFSVRKLLTRAVRAEHDLKEDLRRTLREVWENAPLRQNYSRLPPTSAGSAARAPAMSTPRPSDQTA
jgi:hypothetical protein